MLSGDGDWEDPVEIPLTVQAVATELLLREGQESVTLLLGGGDPNHREAHLSGPGGHHSPHRLVGHLPQSGPQVLCNGVAVLSNVNI